MHQYIVIMTMTMILVIHSFPFMKKIICTIYS